MSEAKRDNNKITTLLGTHSVDGITPIKIWVNPTTHALITEDGTTGADYSDDIAKRDNNGVPVLMGVSSIDGITPTAVYANALTNALLINSN